MFSGGLDSTYVLHKILTDPVYEAHDVHVHHMKLVNKENREKAESTAVKKVIEYFRSHEYRPFIVSYTDVVYPEDKMVRDAFMVSMVAGQICSQDPSIKFVAIGINDSDLEDPLLDDIRIKTDELFKKHPSNAVKIFPAIKLTKTEVRDALDSELVQLTWSCRTPIYKYGISFKCRRCRPCNLLK